jgi:hypothetical protein
MHSSCCLPFSAPPLLKDISGLCHPAVSFHSSVLFLQSPSSAHSRASGPSPLVCLALGSRPHRHINSDVNRWIVAVVVVMADCAAILAHVWWETLVALFLLRGSVSRNYFHFSISQPSLGT